MGESVGNSQKFSHGRRVWVLRQDEAAFFYEFDILHNIHRINY